MHVAQLLYSNDVSVKHTWAKKVCNKIVEQMQLTKKLLKYIWDVKLACHYLPLVLTELFTTLIGDLTQMYTWTENWTAGDESADSGTGSN